MSIGPDLVRNLGGLTLSGGDHDGELFAFNAAYTKPSVPRTSHGRYLFLKSNPST